MIKIEFLEKFKQDAAIICTFVAPGLKLSENTAKLNPKLVDLIEKSLLESDSFTAKLGQVKSASALLDGNLHKVFVFGTGDVKDLSESKIQDLGGNVYSTLKASRAKEGFVDSIKLGKFENEEFVSHLAFGIKLASYSFDKYFTNKKKEDLPLLEKVEIFASDLAKTKATHQEFDALAEGIFLARNVATEPGNVLYPESYSKIIAENLEKYDVKVEILGVKEMEKLGMHSLLGVGIGSSKESKLVVMSYNPLDSKDQPVALVGKGVTFDTGGISIKPSRSMHEMKFDMSGSAAVVGTILALAKRKAKVNVVGVVGLVENMPDGNAQRPGDVVKSMSGQTIEVLDTDAEGRLVLADALWYTQDRFKPKIMIDLATLTGAVSIALGRVYAGLMTNSDSLAEKLTLAGKNAGEELWRLPLHESFDKMIKSDIADMANLGAPAGHASSSIGGQFLQRFVNKVDWAHLDIANVAYDTSKGSPTAPKGSVGYGIKLLNRLIKDNYEQ